MVKSAERVQTRRLRTAVYLLLAGCLLLTACLSSPRVDLRNPADKWRMVSEDHRLLLLVTCPSGIGAVRISFRGQPAHRALYLGFRYSEGRPFTKLEGFRIRDERGIEWSGIPTLAREGCLALQIPDEALKSPGELHFEWVDFYR